MTQAASPEVPDRYALARRRFEGGESIRSIAKALGIRRQSIMDAMKRSVAAGDEWAASGAAPAPGPGGAGVRCMVRAAAGAIPGDEKRTEEQLARQNDAFRLFSTGASITGIANLLKVTRDTVYADIRHEAIRRNTAFPGERDIFVQRQLQTLDTLQNQLMSKFAKRTPTEKEPNPPESPAMDPQTSAEIRKIEERRAHLLGLDAPKQLVVKGSSNPYVNGPNPLVGMAFEDKKILLERALQLEKERLAGMINVTPPPATTGAPDSAPGNGDTSLPGLSG